jgi:hypothetical protein
MPSLMKILRRCHPTVRAHRLARGGQLAPSLAGEGQQTKAKRQLGRSVPLDKREQGRRIRWWAGRFVRQLRSLSKIQKQVLRDRARSASAIDQPS